MGFSYGCRQVRSQHEALDALAVGVVMRKVNWVLVADIPDFFGSMSHERKMKLSSTTTQEDAHVAKEKDPAGGDQAPRDAAGRAAEIATGPPQAL